MNAFPTPPQPDRSNAQPAFVIAHTADGPVVFAQTDGEQPPRRMRRSRDARRRRLAIMGGLALIAGIGAGGTAFALGQGTSASAAGSGTATVVENWGSPYGSGSGAGAGGTSGSTSNGYGYGYGGGGTTGSGGYGYGSGSTGADTSTGVDTSTSAVAASAEQTAGVVTIVSDLAYQGAQSAGTGIVLTSDGLILTNNHVVEGSTAIEVTDELSGEVYDATVVGTDATHDIAVLQLDGASDLATASLGDSDSVAVGDAVTAVGNAEGTGDLVAAAGTVTALEQTITTQSETGIQGETLDGLFQIDADIVSGDSGGPLVDASGDVVGINTAASSGSADIVGFAIPISDALDIASQILAGSDTEFIEIGYPGFLGISVAQDSTRQATGNTAGATVAGVIAGTPAESAGLAAGDVITAVNGESVASGTALSALLATMEPGDTVTLDVTTTSGSTGTVSVTLMQGPAA